MTATDVTPRPCARPVLIGDRIAALRADLGSGATTLALVVGVGLIFLVAGLRPTVVDFSDAGAGYSARCGIETVLAGSSWEALDAACEDGAGLRVLAVAGGALLVLGGIGQLGWLALRRPGASGPVRRAVAGPAGRWATAGLVLAALVGAGAVVVEHARRDASALTGDCLAGTASCVGTATAGPVQAAAALVALSCLVVLLRPFVARRPPAATAALGLGALAVLLLLLAAQPVAVETGSGDDALRATCGMEVLIAGHPQASVTAACRDAMGHRAAFALIGTTLAAGAGALFWASRDRPDRLAVTDESADAPDEVSP